MTHCATLLSEREGAPQIKNICSKIGSEGAPCEWVWLPLEGGNLEVLRQTDVRSLVEKLRNTIDGRPFVHIYFHCSAGIHRTGFLVYIILRLNGHDRAEARTYLERLRKVTADQVGTERLELAEQLIKSWAKTTD